MPYSHKRTHGLELAACELGSTVTTNGAGDTKGGQPVANHHDCNLLGYQPPFARRCGHNVAALSVHTKDHEIKNLFSDMHFRHGEDVHGHALHGLVRYRRLLWFPSGIPIV